MIQHAHVRSRLLSSRHVNVASVLNCATTHYLFIMWSLYMLHTMCSMQTHCCLLYTSDAADDMQCVDLGGRRIIKKERWGGGG